MDIKFDLNIDNYTIRELEELLELPNSYDESIIEMKEIKLRENIISDKSILSSTKNMTLDFINNVKKRLKTNHKLNLTPISKLAKNWENIYNTNKSLGKSDLALSTASFTFCKAISGFTSVLNSTVIAEKSC